MGIKFQDQMKPVSKCGAHCGYHDTNSLLKLLTTIVDSRMKSYCSKKISLVPIPFVYLVQTKLKNDRLFRYRHYSWYKKSSNSLQFQDCFFNLLWYFNLILNL